MQSPRHAQALLCTCSLLAVTVLCSLAMRSPASEQMAEKHRISLQLRQDVEQCGQLAGAAAELCQRQALGHAELARAELQAHRLALRQARSRSITAHHRLEPARCNALPRRLREGCLNALPAPETS